MPLTRPQRVHFSSTPTPGATGPNLSRSAQKKLLSAIAANDDWLDSDSELDVKPVVPKVGPSSSKDKGKGKGKAPRAEVIELSSGSESEDSSQKEREQSKLERDLSRVRAVVPDAHSKWLIKLYRDPRFECDPNRIVEELLTSNYPLRNGGWKHPREETERGQQKKGNGESPTKKKQAGSDKDKGKNKRTHRDSEDEDEEVDQLDSDEEQAADDEDEDDAKEYTREEAVQEAKYWLGNVNRKFGDDAYRKAACVVSPTSPLRFA